MKKDMYKMSINNREDFAEFLLLLSEDSKENSDEWENPTLDRFLEAMAAYTTVIHNYYRNSNKSIDVDSGNPPWQLFADILLGAKIYE